MPRTCPTRRSNEDLNAFEGRREQCFEQVDERFCRMGEEIESLQARLTQRIELAENQMEPSVAQLRSDRYRALLIGFGAVAALVTVLNAGLG